MMRFFPVLIFCLMLALPTSIHAQVLQASSAQGEKAPEESKPVDALGRETPRGTVEGFLKAVADEDMGKAAEYLDLSSLPSARRRVRGPLLAEELQSLLDQSGWLAPAAILSADPEGKQGDDLAPDTDKIGTIRNGEKSVDVLVQRVSGEENGPQVWLIAAQTVGQIPAMVEGLGEPPVNKVLPTFLIDRKWHGAPVGHWLAVLVIFAVSYSASWIVVHALARGARRIGPKREVQEKAHFIDAFIIPMSLYLAVWVFSISGVFVGISVIVRQYFGQLNIIVAWTSLALLLWRLIDVGAEIAQKRMSRAGRYHGFSSIIFFVRRLTKFVFAILLGILILNSWGVDVTAGLAALGIGGIALALGAQKTLENFIGSLSIVLDQPVHIGDFCKIGDTTGTIEDIGMRSTRVRTNDRTVVTIPNGDLSTLRIENYARRERFLLHTKLRIRYDARPDQIRDLTHRLKDMLAKAEKVAQDPAAVRFIGFSPEALVIEIFVYITTADHPEFLRVQENIMLQIMEAVEASGCYFALPSQTFLPAATPA